MSRFKAAGIHLLLSASIAILLILLMFGIWYPHAYFSLMGGDGLVYLILGVDVCLGPFLTLIVFNTHKKSLRFDLAVIAILQVGALSYGVYTMFNARPVFTVYAGGEFQVAAASEINNAELNKATNAAWKKLPLTGPLLLAAIEPLNKKEKEEIDFLASFGAGLAQFPRLFVTYESQKKEILKNAKPLLQLSTSNSKNKAVIDKFLAKQSHQAENFLYMPISSAYSTETAILDSKTADFIGIIKINPLSE